MDKVCGTCQFAHMEVDNHDDVSIECRKYPPTIINSGSLAKFPKILPKWHCGEYSEGDKNYCDLLPSLSITSTQHFIIPLFLQTFILIFLIKFHTEIEFL